MKNRAHFNLLFSVISILSNQFIFGQNYWQQEVNYTINVALNDVSHSLTGSLSLEYVNNSPDVLDKIYFHLWPNAYRNRNTALAKQLYRNGNDVLFTCSDSLRGNIDSLFFTTNGTLLNWTYDKKNIDICLVYLETPLRPGEHVTIETPFKVQIPSGEISRLGHIGQSYQITQWYPKPAVYDSKGWHPMPYLNQGEFFSEYGSFDVSITLPENYVVGATGDLQTEEEKIFLNGKLQETKAKLEEYKTLGKRDKMDFPKSSEKFKTIRFKQSKVHDFAWFADKRYAVLKGEVELPHSKRKVETWSMFVPNNAKTWESSIEYLNDGTYYYSLWNGDYPYNHVTAVDGTISAGGGMEYPNITVIGNASSKRDLEVVIVHEVGHNWFYGILGSNERDHGWMDEGLNTLNEMRYIKTKYPGDESLSDMLLGGKLHFDKLSHHDMGDISTQVISVLRKDQPVQTHSADFTSTNYGIIMYQKTGLIFLYLKDYLGEFTFDQVMQTYFNQWKFKHPYPSDLRETAESISGKKLDWLFEGLINSTGLIDYKIQNVSKIKDSDSTRIKIKRKGQIKGPVLLNLHDYSGNSQRYTIEPQVDAITLAISKDSIERIFIDEPKNIPDAFRSNNVWSHKVFPTLEPLKIEFLSGDNEMGKNNVFWNPVFNVNTYDKVNLGLGIHNLSVPLNRFQYLLAPSISLKRIRPTGSLGFSYRIFAPSAINRVIVGAHAGMFGAGENDNSQSMHISPFVKWNPASKKDMSLYNEFTIRGGWRKDVYDLKQFEQLGFFVNHLMNYKKTNFRMSINSRYEYVHRTRSSDSIPFNTPVVSLHRIQSTMKIRYDYLKYGKKKSFYLGLHSGGNMAGSGIKEFNYSFTGSSGDQDFFMENPFFGRFDQNGWLSNQRLDNMGEFNTAQKQLVNIDYLTALNFSAQLPYVPNFLVLFTNYGWSAPYFAFNSGVGIRFGEMFSVDLPLYRTGNAFGAVDFKNYINEIRFVFKLRLSETIVNLESLLK